MSLYMMSSFEYIVNIYVFMGKSYFESHQQHHCKKFQSYTFILDKTLTPKYPDPGKGI